MAVETRVVWRAVTAPVYWWDPKHTWSGDAANLSLAVEPGGCFCESWEDGGTRLTLDYRVAGALDGNWAEPVDRVLGGLLKRLGEYAEKTPPDAAGGAHGNQSS